MMTEHAIAFEELIDIAFGTLQISAEDSRGVHIAGCAECQSTLRHFATTQETVQLDARAIPSSASLLRVQGLIESRKPRIQERESTVRRIFAALSFDSRQSYAATGLRGKGDSYLLSYTQSDTTLDLEIGPSAHADDSVWHITGQIDLPATSGQADIALIGGRGAKSATNCDEFGVFSFAVEPGIYDLFVSLDSTTLVFPEVEVGERDSR